MKPLGGRHVVREADRSVMEFLVSPIDLQEVCCITRYYWSLIRRDIASLSFGRHSIGVKEALS